MIWFLLIWCVVTLVASVYVVKNLDARKQDMLEYVLTGTLGMLCIPASVFGIMALIYVLICQYIA